MTILVYFTGCELLNSWQNENSKQIKDEKVEVYNMWLIFAVDNDTLKSAAASCQP